MKTPAPQRAAGRRKLAAEHKALPDGTDPIPDLAYLRKAIRSIGRVSPSKRPAVKALIRKRAKALGALNAPGVKGTWAFEASNDSEAVELATMTRRPPAVRGMADVRAARTAPGAITVRHKSTGAKIGTLTAAGNGYQGHHADGTKTPASGSMAGAMAGLIAYHNKMAKGTPAVPAGQGAGIANLKGYAGDSDALDLAGALPFTSNATSMDGPRVTAMGSGKKPATVAAAKLSLPAQGVAVYRKLRKRGMSHGQALALAKRAAMKAKAA